MIAAIVIDHFQAGIEQQDNHLLPGRPVGVVGSAKGALLLAVSREAGAQGLMPGIRWAEAQDRCPELARVVARPARYAEVSARFVAALGEVAPAIEVFAEDEAFIDLTDCQAYYRHDAVRVARLIEEAVKQATGLVCRVGVSGDKTTARLAARQTGREGIAIVPPEAAQGFLAPLPLELLLGPDSGMAGFLAGHGVHCCGDMRRISVHLPARRFGNLGRRVWLMAQGQDPEPVKGSLPPAGGPALQRRLPPMAKDPLLLQTALFELGGRLAGQLRRERLLAREFRLGLRAPEGWRQDALCSELPTDDMRAIVPLCAQFLKRCWHGEAVSELRIQARPHEEPQRQPDIFLRTGGRHGTR